MRVQLAATSTCSMACLLAALFFVPDTVRGQQSSGKAIHDAIAAGDVAKVRTLVASTPTLVDAKAGNGATPLIAAVHFKKTEILKLLLEKGAAVNAGVGHSGTALWYASADGNLEAARLLLDKGAMVDAKDSDNSTPLLIAAENGQLEVVRLLLSKGAAVNSAADEASRHNGATPLIGATKGAQDYQAPIGGVRATSPNRKHGYLEVVSLLLEKGAAVNKKDNFGATALIYASENGQVDVVSLLLAKGAMVDAKTNEGKPALYYASGNPDVTKVLLEKGANPAGAK